MPREIPHAWKNTGRETGSVLFLYTQAEERTGVSHADFSCIRQTKFIRFTIDRLISILGRLGQAVERSVTVHPRVAPTQDTNPAHP